MAADAEVITIYDAAELWGVNYNTLWSRVVSAKVVQPVGTRPWSGGKPLNLYRLDEIRPLAERPIGALRGGNRRKKAAPNSPTTGVTDFLERAKRLRELVVPAGYETAIAAAERLNMTTKALRNRIYAHPPRADERLGIGRKEVAYRTAYLDRIGTTTVRVPAVVRPAAASVDYRCSGCGHRYARPSCLVCDLRRVEYTFTAIPRRSATVESVPIAERCAGYRGSNREERANY